MKEKKKTAAKGQKKKVLCADHPKLLEIAKQAKTTVYDNPILGMLFMVDPVRAMKEMGAKLTDSMKQRVKKTIRTSKLAEGNRLLYNRVKKGTHTIPWVTKVTFRKSKIADEIGR